MKNPAVSAKQYRLAEAVLHGTVRGKSRMSKAAAQDLIDATPAKLRSEFMQKHWAKNVTDRVVPFGRKNPAGNRYEQVAAEYIDRVKQKYPDIHITRKKKPPYWAGQNSDGSLYMKIPKPNTAGHLYSVIHECGHILLGH